jgi:SAM-dependent methyltransferase
VAPAPDCAPVADFAAALHRLGERLARTPPLLVALLAQLVAVAAALPLGQAEALPLPAWAVHGVIAAAASLLLGLPGWWLPINLGFVPAALWLRTAELHPGWFLAAFAAMVALFWTTYRSRVPLYLSGRRACDTLAGLLPQERAFRLIDLGCGFGGVLDRLSRHFAQGRFQGIEIAPLPAWIASLRARRGTRFEVTRGDFFQRDLSDCDVIYAFLSPAPMEALWAKVEREARPGTLFVSNSFGVPGVEPHQVVPLGRSGRALYVWRL